MSEKYPLRNWKNEAEYDFPEIWRQRMRCTPLSRQESRKFKVGFQPRFRSTQVSLFGIRKS